MSAAAGSAWDAQQLEWLRALGHEVLTLAGAPPPPDTVAAPVTGAIDSGMDRRARDARPSERSAAGSGTRASAPRAPVPAGATDLLEALARAARCSRDDEQFLRVLPPLTSLHGNPAARRALWPQLRALRRRSLP